MPENDAAPIPQTPPTAVKDRTNRSARTPNRPPLDHDRAVLLVGAAQAGDTDAFGQLYTAYHGMVLRYVYYRVSTRELAEDLTSETFVRALRRITTFSWQGRDFGAWLVTIARNLVADYFKSKRLRVEFNTSDGDIRDADAESVDGADIQVLAVFDSEAINRAIDCLTPVQAECIRLRFWRQYSIAETADAMDRSSGAIKTLQYRATRTLAKLLSPEMSLAA